MDINGLITMHNALATAERLKHLEELNAGDYAAWWPERGVLWVFDGTGREEPLGVDAEYRLSAGDECKNGECSL